MFTFYFLHTSVSFAFLPHLSKWHFQHINLKETFVYYYVYCWFCSRNKSIGSARRAVILRTEYYRPGHLTLGKSFYKRTEPRTQFYLLYRRKGMFSTEEDKFTSFQTQGLLLRSEGASSFLLKKLFQERELGSFFYSLLNCGLNIKGISVLRLNLLRNFWRGLKHSCAWIGSRLDA